MLLDLGQDTLQLVANETAPRLKRKVRAPNLIHYRRQIRVGPNFELWMISFGLPVAAAHLQLSSSPTSPPTSVAYYPAAQFQSDHSMT
jgi:hypothetical protein